MKVSLTAYKCDKYQTKHIKFKINVTYIPINKNAITFLSTAENFFLAKNFSYIIHVYIAVLCTFETNFQCMELVTL